MKAVSEHRVPKIDTPRGEKKEEGEREMVEWIHICKTKSPDSRTVTMINYRLEITVNRKEHMCTQTHIYSNTHTHTPTSSPSAL